MNPTTIIIGGVLFCVATTIISPILLVYARRKANKEYNQLQEDFQREIQEATENADDLVGNISNLVNFALSYSLFRKARGKEKKTATSLEMAVWWDRLPRTIQLRLANLGKEAKLEAKEEGI